MAEFIFTPEQKEAWEFIEKRRARFAERITRVAARLHELAAIEWICECCGYPDLYFSTDERYACPVCTWDPGEYEAEPQPRSPHLYEDQREKPVVMLADARVNFLRRGCCFTENTTCFGGSNPDDWALDLPEQRKAIIAALDALEADTDPGNDEKHWKAIRRAFNEFARLYYSDSDWNRIGMQSWTFADKIERM